MYVFSVTATSKTPQSSFSAGVKIPFIVYIDFKDLYGAEKLCQLYLMQESFENVEIEKRKLIPNDKLTKTFIDNDAAIKAALDTGYMIQMFDAH